MVDHEWVLEFPFVLSLFGIKDIEIHAVMRRTRPALIEERSLADDMLRMWNQPLGSAFDHAAVVSKLSFSIIVSSNGQVVDQAAYPKLFKT